MPGDCSFPLSPSIFDAHNSFVILYLVAKTMKKLEIIFEKINIKNIAPCHTYHSTRSLFSLFALSTAQYIWLIILRDHSLYPIIVNQNTVFYFLSHFFHYAANLKLNIRRK